MSKLYELIPTNWLDSLLTGPDAVVSKSGDYNGSDIERLLSALRERVRKAEDSGVQSDAEVLRLALKTARDAIRGNDIEHIWINYPKDDPSVSLGDYLDGALGTPLNTQEGA